MEHQIFILVPDLWLGLVYTLDQDKSAQTTLWQIQLFERHLLIQLDICPYSDMPFDKLVSQKT